MSKVSSQNNINLILEIISESVPNNVLVNIKSEIKQFVNNRCNWYHPQRLKYNGLKDMNQRIIKETYEYAQKISKQNQNPNNLSNMYSKKGKDFELRLKSHQENFNTLINGNKPDEIDFSDNIDSEQLIDSDNMEYIMNQTLNDREKELEKITIQYSQQDTKKANEWINGNNNNPIKLNIKESIKLDNVTNMAKKKVSFNLDEQSRKKIDVIQNIDIINEIKDFMNNQNNVSFQNIVLEKLEEIVKNQEKIIKHLDIKKKQNPTSILNNKD